MATHTQIVVFLILLVACFAQAAIKIAISHCNDVSAQFKSFELGTHLSSNAPPPCIRNQEKCVGGFAGVVHWMNENKTSGYDFSRFPASNILRLSSGNLIGGESGWISSLETENGWWKYGEMVARHIKPSVLSLGMKEFGAGLQQTITFMNAVRNESSLIEPEKMISFSLANTCETTYSGTEDEFCKIINPFKLIEVVDHDSNLIYPIGIIGFVTPTVERLSLPGNLQFSNIVSSLKSIIAQYPFSKTFIAMGDGSLEIAKAILDQVPQVKLVIYGAGFANTLNMTDEYPQRYKHGFIATAGRYGSSVGKMVLELNKESGNINVLNSELKVTSHPGIWNADAMKAIYEVMPWEAQVYARMGEVVGQTRVKLEGGEICRRQECSLGNLMADAAVHCALQQFSIHSPFQFPLHAVWHSGAFSSELVIGAGFQGYGSGNVSKFHIHKWLPYHNNVHVVAVTGFDLGQVLELSASGINPSTAARDWGQFLQVSNGLEVRYDNKTDLPTVTKVRIQHDVNGVPQMGDLQNDTVYYLAIPTFLYEGRGIYNFSRKIWSDATSQTNFGFDDNCLQGYIQSLKYIMVGIEERILIDNGDESGNGNVTSTSTPPTTKGEGAPEPSEPTPSKGTKMAITLLMVLTAIFCTYYTTVSMI